MKTIKLFLSIIILTFITGGCDPKQYYGCYDYTTFSRSGLNSTSTRLCDKTDDEIIQYMKENTDSTITTQCVLR